MGGASRYFKTWLSLFKGNRDTKCQNLSVTEITYRACAGFDRNNSQSMERFDLKRQGVLQCSLKRQSNENTAGSRSERQENSTSVVMDQNDEATFNFIYQHLKMFNFRSFSLNRKGFYFFLKQNKKGECSLVKKSGASSLLNNLFFSCHLTDRLFD